MKDERVWGVIRTGDACRYYTFFKEIFEKMGDFQNEYNWLITDIDMVSTKMDLNNLLQKSHFSMR